MFFFLIFFQHITQKRKQITNPISTADIFSLLEVVHIVFHRLTMVALATSDLSIQAAHAAGSPGTDNVWH